MPDSAQIEKISDKDFGTEGAKGRRALVIAARDRTDREAHLQKELRRHAAGGAGGAADEDSQGFLSNGEGLDQRVRLRSQRVDDGQEHLPG